jgi:GNAT superfamily N-acetyltransferase
MNTVATILAEVKLPAGYEIREMENAEFEPLWQKSAELVFADSQFFRFFYFISEEEKSKYRDLAKFYKDVYSLRLGLFYKNEFVGWSCGDQHSAEAYYMRNSGILKEHRKKGLYTALLNATVKILTEKGFQRIFSRHNASNNEVIIPKLKFGFTITAMEISDVFGTLVHLTYFPNPLRRKVMIYRDGNLMPDEELKAALKL